MKKSIEVIVTAGALGYAAIVCFYYAVTDNLNHDENQFMASAYMVARYGLHPYRDFAYFHMPNLVYVYSLFFFTPAPYLTARLFNGACAFALCLSVYIFARSVFRSLGSLATTGIAAASAILLPNNDLFQIVSGKVWNHSSATFCAVLCFFLLNKALSNSQIVYFGLSGLALGLATGIRLTFAPLFAPFLLLILIWGTAPWRDKILQALVFGSGAATANLPAIYFFLTSYSDFMFGNFSYPKLNTRYFTEHVHQFNYISLTGKLRHLMETMFDDSTFLIPMVAFLSLLLLGIRMLRTPTRFNREVLLLATALPFLFLGCFVATPTQYQYFFAPLPFLLLLGLAAFANLGSAKLCWVIALAAAISFFHPGKSKRSMSELGGVFHPSSWVPMRIEAESRWIANHIISRRRAGVLTLSPIFAAEAGLPIYKGFINAPFGWRVSEFVSSNEAALRKLPWSPGIEEWLSRDPPLAVVSGGEIDWWEEAPIIREIKRLGYRAVKTPKGLVLWQAVK